MKKRLYRLFQWIYKGVPVIKVNPSISYLQDSEKLKGKALVVIGGSRGVGYSIAEKCIANGANVVIVSRYEESLIKASKGLGGCPWIEFDISGTTDFRMLFDKAADLLGTPPDSLVYTASLYLHEKSINEVTPDGFDRQFATNVKAPFFIGQQFTEYIESKGMTNANLLFISSEMGLYCSDVPYGLGKASLNSLVAGLARRYAGHGIRVNAIAPGVLMNEIPGATEEDLFRKQACGNRYIMPNEIAEVASFILSDASNCISGAIIPCNQGNHYRCDW